MITIDSCDQPDAIICFIVNTVARPIDAVLNCIKHNIDFAKKYANKFNFAFFCQNTLPNTQPIN